MDVFEGLASRENVIRVVDMHTSGEPTRIIVSGYPDLKGETLLEKRRYAMDYQDDIRKLYDLILIYRWSAPQRDSQTDARNSRA
ncbi:hypothetical protein MPER_05229 [Moniliophthora perniciosa FA553]|nr:hypothetical protein MPER_05229 [Moniliophthora perniciosa FA553]